LGSFSISDRTMPLNRSRASWLREICRNNITKQIKCHPFIPH
jgi:hypothetical protein